MPQAVGVRVKVRLGSEVKCSIILVEARPRPLQLSPLAVYWLITAVLVRMSLPSPLPSPLPLDEAPALLLVSCV